MISATIFSQPLQILHTINISGSERHDGEKPYTYVVQAPTMIQAKRLAWIHHLWLDIAEQGTVPAEHPGFDPDLVVIDSPCHPCTPGAPSCPSPVHYNYGAGWITDPQPPCRCRWHWQWVDWRPGHYRPISVTRLTELGYRIPTGRCPEENA